MGVASGGIRIALGLVTATEATEAAADILEAAPWPLHQAGLGCSVESSFLAAAQADWLSAGSWSRLILRGSPLTPTAASQRRRSHFAVPTRLYSSVLAEPDFRTACMARKSGVSWKYFYIVLCLKAETLPASSKRCHADTDDILAGSEASPCLTVVAFHTVYNKSY